MHMRVVVSQVHRMGRVAKPKTLKALSLTKVKALARSPDTNISNAKKVSGGYPFNQTHMTS